MGSANAASTLIAGWSYYPASRWVNNEKHTSSISFDFGASVPGVSGIKVDLALGEGLQNGSAVISEPQRVPRSAHLRLRAVAEMGGSGPLAGLRIRLPLYIDLTYAIGGLDDADDRATDCSSSELFAGPNVANFWIGEVGDKFSTLSRVPVVAAAKIVDDRLVKITGHANISASNTEKLPLSFSSEDADAGTINCTETRSLTGKVVTSLLKALELDAEVAGVSVGLGAKAQVTSPVSAALHSVAASLDAIIDDILSTLGVKLHDADIRINAERTRTIS